MNTLDRLLTLAIFLPLFQPTYAADKVNSLKTMTAVRDLYPDWSPDGTKLVFNRQYVADESSIDILVYDSPLDN